MNKHINRILKGQFLYILLLWISIQSPAYTQELNFDVELFTMQDGLNANVIYDVTKDKEGYLWVLNTKGLQKFNSQSFESVFDMHHVGFLAQNMELDHSGMIWLFTKPLNGIRYNVKVLNEELGKWVSPTQYFNLPSGYYVFIGINGDGRMQVGIEVDDDVKYFRIEGKNQIIEIEKPKVITGRSFLLEKEFDLGYDQKELVPMPNILKSIYPINDSNFLLKLSTNKGSSYLLIDTIKQTISNHAINHRDAVIDKNFNAISFEQYEIQFQNLLTGKSYDLTKELNRKVDLLAYNSVYIDDDLIWICTNKGLLRVTYKSAVFSSYLTNKHVSTRGILFTDENSICALSYSGIKHVNLNDSTVRGFNHDFDDLEYLYAMQKWSGKTFITTHGTIVFEIEDGKPGYKSHKINQYPSEWKKTCFCENGNESLLVSNGAQISEYLNSDSERTFKEIDTSCDLQNSECYHFLKEDKSYYHCSSIGLVRFDEDFIQCDHFFQDTLVTFITKDANISDEFWIGTEYGLVRWNQKSGVSDLFNNEHGLIDYNITAVVQDQYTNLWVPTFKGLHLFNTTSERFQHFTSLDGIANNEFNHGSWAIQSDDLFCFGGITGITVIQPSNFIQEEFKAIETEINLKHVKSLGANNKLYDLEINDDSDIETIKVPESAVQIHVGFTDLNFHNIKSKKYKYSITSEDEITTEWNEINENTINIGRQGYGSSYLSIQSYSLDNIPMSKVKKVKLQFVKPIYKTIPFFIASVLTTIFLVYLYNLRHLKILRNRNLKLENEVNLRTQEILKKNYELEELIDTKDKVFAILAHDLRSPLISLNDLSSKINFLIKKNEPERLLEMGQYIQNKVNNLSRFLDNILNWSIQQRNHTQYNPKVINLGDIVNQIIPLFEESISNKNLSLTLSTMESADVFIDSQAITIIIRNLLHNAIKYSNVQGSIDIDFIKNGRYGLLSISDQGVGIDEKELFNDEYRTKSNPGTFGEKGVGLGLVICHELAALNQSELKLMKNRPQGTTCILKIPLPVA